MLNKTRRVIHEWSPEQGNEEETGTSLDDTILLLYDHLKVLDVRIPEIQLLPHKSVSMNLKDLGFLHAIMKWYRVGFIYYWTNGEVKECHTIEWRLFLEV